MDLCYKHIEEVESLEKKRFNDKTSENRSMLMTQVGSGGESGTQLCVLIDF